jgi:hypothetical protein
MVKEVTIEIEDKRKPILEIETPEDNERFRKDQALHFSGTCSDDHLIQSFIYYLDEQSSSPVDITDIIIDGSWALQLELVDLSDGIHEIFFRTVDPSGNTVGASLEFEVLEIDPPFLRIDSPSQGSIIREGMIAIEGEVSDISGIRSFRISFNGGDWENIRTTITDDGHFSYEFNAYGINNGTHTFRFIAEDRVDNFIEETLQITIDGIEPSISIPIELRNPIMKQRGGFLLDGYVNDTSGISSLKLVPQTGSGEFNLMPYLNGNYLHGIISLDEISYLKSPRLEIVATDSAGLSSAITIELTIDETPPSGELLPLDPVLIGEIYGIDLRISDDTWFRSILLTIHDGTEMNLTEDVSSFGWNMIEVGTQGSQPGMHTITLYGIDIVGNDVRAFTQVFLYDLTSDYDGDGMPDWWELEYDIDHLTDDSIDDPDNDGFTNFEEYLGDDKEPGADDWSDPQNIGSNPVYPSSDTDSNALLILIIVGIIIIILLIGGMMTVLLIRSKSAAGPQVPLPPSQGIIQPAPQQMPIAPVPKIPQIQRGVRSTGPQLPPPPQNPNH